MKIKEGFILRNVSGSNIVVAVGSAAKEFNGMIRLNGVGAFIWSCLEQDTTEEEIVKAVMEKYDVEEKKADIDVKKFIDRLTEAGFIE